MEEILSTQFESASRAIQSGLFECPCGKKYRSYPAIFKHIKNKHNGKPPGEIVRPKAIPKKRGRPALIQKPTQNLLQKKQHAQAPQSRIFLSNPSIEIQKMAICDPIIKLSAILRRLPNQSLNKSHFSDLSSIHEMNCYLCKTRGDSRDRESIGGRFTQMLEQLSSQIVPSQLQQFFTFLMVFLQYVIDQHYDRNIITSGHVDILCNFLDRFIEYKAQQMAQYYEINNLSIFNEDIMLELFEEIFAWLVLKNYTTYKVTLIRDFKKEVETIEYFDNEFYL